MEYVKSFRELEVYKLSRQLAEEIFEVSKGFQKKRNVFPYRSGKKIVTVYWGTNYGSMGETEI